MTDEQKTMIMNTWEEIRKLPGGSLIELNADGISVIRMEYVPKRKHYRMASIGSGCGQEEIRNRMLDLYHKLMQAAGREKICEN